MLRVSDNHRFLIHDDGHPFLYLADTGWMLFHRLNREDAAHYLRTRARQCFTVIQAVGLAEKQGITSPNAQGEFAFIDGDIRRPNEKYWEHVDYIVDTAASLGLHVGFLPSWGDKVGVGYWGDGPQHFINEDNAAYWGAWLGKRYGAAPVIWILGGDRVADGNERIWNRMARAIREADGGHNLMSYHPMGGYSSSSWFHEADWLDFNMAQTGHGAFNTNFITIENDYARAPVKPCMDGEPTYEAHPDHFNHTYVLTNDYQVRAAAYWSLFAGAHGHTYGCHPVWQFFNPARFPAVNSAMLPWREALELPGAVQMGHLRRLMMSRPFLTRIPDQSLIRDGQKMRLGHVRATRDGTKGAADATSMMLYFSAGTEVVVDTAHIPGKQLHRWWFDPRSGESLDEGIVANEGRVRIAPPQQRLYLDAVLVIDDAGAGYGPPGGGAAQQRVRTGGR